MGEGHQSGGHQARVSDSELHLLSIAMWRVPHPTDNDRVEHRSVRRQHVPYKKVPYDVPAYEFAAWHVLFAPRGTPPAIVTLLSDSLKKILQATGASKQYADRGLT